MKNVQINQDMDAATMTAMKAQFEELANASEDIRLDLHGVNFIDSSGVGGIVFLFKRLRERSFVLSLANVHGQPLRLLQQLQLGFLIAKDQSGAAA